MVIISTILAEPTTPTTHCQDANYLVWQSPHLDPSTSTTQMTHLWQANHDLTLAWKYQHFVPIGFIPTPSIPLLPCSFSKATFDLYTFGALKTQVELLQNFRVKCFGNAIISMLVTFHNLPTFVILATFVSSDGSFGFDMDDKYIARARR